MNFAAVVCEVDPSQTRPDEAPRGAVHQQESALARRNAPGPGEHFDPTCVRPAEGGQVQLPGAVGVSCEAPSQQTAVDQPIQDFGNNMGLHHQGPVRLMAYGAVSGMVFED